MKTDPCNICDRKCNTEIMCCHQKICWRCVKRLKNIFCPFCRKIQHNDTKAVFFLLTKRGKRFALEAWEMEYTKDMIPSDLQPEERSEPIGDDSNGSNE